MKAEGKSKTNQWFRVISHRVIASHFILHPSGFILVSQD